MPFHRLYMRIWLAVVLAVAVLALLVGWVWRMTAEPPLRNVVVRNQQGQVVGQGKLRPPSGAPEHAAQAPPHEAPSDAGAPDADPPNTAEPDSPDTPAHPHARPGSGPEFTVHMQDGAVLQLHLPRPGRGHLRPPFGFFGMLGVVAVAVALGLYPIVRRLTRRLEVLQSGVERWGAGDLAVRVPLHGRDEVGFLAERFNHAAQRIETLVASRDALLQTQKTLLANTSHELRSPLARIRMGLELMDTAAPNPHKDEMVRNIAELDQLIEEILLASRLDTPDVALGTVEVLDLGALLAQECQRTGAVLQSPAQAVLVPGVAKLLRRAVRNLLENAHRHAAASAVQASVGLRGGQAVITVRDFGPGVPAELSERIFEPFYRLPGASERDGGVGLGLALVRSIAQRHGGSAHCTPPSAGGGACFEIHLPTQPAAA